MTENLHLINAALLPHAGLAALAELRCRADVHVVLGEDRVWATWPAGDESVLRRLLPVIGAEFFRNADDTWFAHGSRLPARNVPLPGAPRLLQDALTPAPFTPLGPEDVVLTPVAFRLVPCQILRATTAALYRLADLEAWADGATSIRLTSFTAARLNDEVLLRGNRLPSLPNSARFWGERVLLPLAFRLDPDLAADAVCEALGVSNEEIVLWTAAGPEAIARECFQPLLRAGLRLATEEVASVGEPGT
jgi:hypothetical protein